MSEYQYYEFQAVDLPLTPDQMSEIRACSSRARITPGSFVNVYNFGNFKGNPDKWMEAHFDAFLYMANWGSRRFMLRLPKRQVLRRGARQLGARQEVLRGGRPRDRLESGRCRCSRAALSQEGIHGWVRGNRVQHAKTPGVNFHGACEASMVQGRQAISLQRRPDGPPRNWQDILARRDPIDATMHSVLALFRPTEPQLPRLTPSTPTA